MKSPDRVQGLLWWTKWCVYASIVWCASVCEFADEGLLPYLMALERIKERGKEEGFEGGMADKLKNK